MVDDCIQLSIPRDDEEMSVSDSPEKSSIALL
jgi:hypothetical protein